MTDGSIVIAEFRTDMNVKWPFGAVCYPLRFRSCGERGKICSNYAVIRTIASFTSFRSTYYRDALMG